MRAGSFLHRALAAALSVTALIALAACAASSREAAEAPASAGAGATAAAPTAAAEPAYAQPAVRTEASIDQAIADLQRAEGDLSLAIGSMSSGGSTSPRSPAVTQPPAATPTDSPVPGAAQKSPAAAGGARSAETELSSDPCFSACRALASMTRATAHLCDLAGDADPRCDNARSRLRGARERVEGSCACGPPG